MKEGMGHGQEVTHLAFVATDLLLMGHNNSQWATRGREKLQWLKKEVSVCLHTHNAPVCRTGITAHWGRQMYCYQYNNSHVFCFVLFFTWHIIIIVTMTLRLNKLMYSHQTDSNRHPPFPLPPPFSTTAFIIILAHRILFNALVCFGPALFRPHHLFVYLKSHK